MMPIYAVKLLRISLSRAIYTTHAGNHISSSSEYAEKKAIKWYQGVTVTQRKDISNYFRI
jgi:hypothetical protein